MLLSRTVMRRILSKIPINKPFAIRQFAVKNEPPRVNLNPKPMTYTPPEILATKNIPIPDDEKRALDQVNENLGLHHFLKRTYLTTGVGIASSLGIAQVLDITSISAYNPLMCFGVGAILSFGSVFALGAIEPTVYKDEYGMLKTENAVSRLASYGGLTSGMGMALAPTVSIMNEIDPMIFPAATGLSLAVMAGASVVAYRCKKNSLLVYGPALGGGLMSLLAIQIMGIGSYLIIGPNIMFDMIHNIDIYGGIALFTGMTAYDTHKAIEMYGEKNPDHIGCATNFYLDFMNLLVRIMEAFAKSKK